MNKEDLAKYRAENWPRMSWRDMFKVEGGQLDPDWDRQLYDYFSRFVPPQEDSKGHGLLCVGCGKLLAGGVVGFLFGATFEWGIAHGHGGCRECGYPATAIHYVDGIIDGFKYVLQPHPNDLYIGKAEADHNNRPNYTDRLEIV